MSNAHQWAEEEFGDVKLGDKRRTKSLVRLAGELAHHPAGTVNRVCATNASRESGYRLLLNKAIPSRAIGDAVFQASARRCLLRAEVIVAVDSTSLHITDTKREKEIGRIGTIGQDARGIHAMSALAIGRHGETIGLCAQHKWIRPEGAAPTPVRPRPSKPAKQKNETHHWIRTVKAASSTLKEHAPDCRPWFQLDRGGDCWQVLGAAKKHGWDITVRATHDRRVDNQAGHLWSALEHAPVMATYRVCVPARPKRYGRKRVGKGKRITVKHPASQARVTPVRVRAAKVPLRVSVSSGRAVTQEFNAVFVSEHAKTKGEPVEWMLLTTREIDTSEQVLAVVRNYALRWRIEDFHRTWKSGLCHVEDSQLRSREALYKWITLLATVATRAMRLIHLARTTPNALATTELSMTELKVLLALRKPKNPPDLLELTLDLAVRWVACLGGYMGSAKSPPPGVILVTRGLRHLVIAVSGFEVAKKM